ncbi:receptor-like protein kinase HERK 1 [Lactuca sativa]|uniref:Protein kinase domain-containing protein n=1 Tax=Lactuca sativa TaxID=4236 RepID=A0A9R1V9H8_LACSA|nr:receptor-like protein kinase HERK 1 [Lactuca sativa]KAJ0200877.1 hypothetical protein LSAT_V11C600328090 [Lactuca sativa]
MSFFIREFAHLKISLESIKSATHNFDACHFIAEGGFGKVYKGEFSRTEGQTIGAVKRWNNDLDLEFRREIMLLSDNKHENLISLIGYCDEEKERILVYEYAPNKSLDFHLADPKLTWVQRLKICLGAARGLEYLHNPREAQRVLHCDIKSANILLDENWNAKIADFGFSKYGPANINRSYLMTQAKGTYGYADPEFVETMIYTKESDVYSFGVVLFEVLCSRFCIDFSCDDGRRSLIKWVKKSSKEEIRDKIIDSNLRQQMELPSFDKFVKLALQCVEREPKRRPSMDFVVRTLESALKCQEKRRFSKIKRASGVLLGIVVATVLL